MFLFSGQNCTKLGFTVPFAQLLTHAGGIVPSRCFDAVRLPTAGHLAAHPFQQLQQGIEVGGFMLQGLVDHHTQRLPLRLFGPITQPLVIALSMRLRVLYNGISVLYTDGIIKPPDRAGAAPKVPKLSLVVQRGGIENDVIMDVFSINVSADNEGVFPLGEAPRQLTAQPVCFFRRDLTRDKGLPEMINFRQDVDRDRCYLCRVTFMP